LTETGQELPIIDDRFNAMLIRLGQNQHHA